MDQMGQNNNHLEQEEEGEEQGVEEVLVLLLLQLISAPSMGSIVPMIKDRLSWLEVGKVSLPFP
jgi:hypothetical protein